MTELTALNSLRLPEPEQITADSALALYEALRPLLPDARSGGNRKAARLLDLLDEFDALILDGFGVINVGFETVPGIETLLEEAARRQIDVLVLTNGASHPSKVSAKKYQGWNLPLAFKDVISSRDALIAHLQAIKGGQGWMALDTNVTPPKNMQGNEALSVSALASAKGFAMLGSTAWCAADQELFEQSLRDNMRPVLIGNPDVTAPLPGSFSAEPAYWIARAMKKLPALQPVWFGKPHSLAFELAYNQLCARAGKPLRKSRIAMVGDSLHTDILGGLAFGLCTVLVTSYGLLRDHNVDKVIAETGIAPDWQVPHL
ncbi:MAG: HAD hydrolase-like protein [Alphaproteobacteria bacterium]|nr:HAD hydrolase-like protein [Alphaproteobacteria bacterium]MBL6776091.1 HAD hydrolase-like protein [Alphaproteobacteria bacterium]